MKKQPLVSIVLTTFKRPDLIGEALNSIISQTYSYWECIIIDDNSNDNTNEIVSQIINKDNRFQFFVKPKGVKQGLPASRNFGIEKSRGDYLVFFDDDDIIHPQLLEICINEFSNDEKIEFVHYKKKNFEISFEQILIKEINNYRVIKLKDNIYEDVISAKLPIASCTVMWQIKYLKNNLFNENLMYAEEWECYSRILIKHNLKGIKIDIPLYFSRKHKNSNTSEFHLNKINRTNSYMLAHELVSKTLLNNNKITDDLAYYLIRKSKKSNKLESKKIISILKSKNFKYSLYHDFFSLKFDLKLFLRNMKHKFKLE